MASFFKDMLFEMLFEMNETFRDSGEWIYGDEQSSNPKPQYTNNLFKSERKSKGQNVKNKGKEKLQTPDPDIPSVQKPAQQPGPQLVENPYSATTQVPHPTQLPSHPTQLPPHPSHLPPQLPHLPRLPQLPSMIPYVQQIPTEQMSLQYIWRYCIYLIISSFLTQLPTILGYFLMQGYSLTWATFFAPKPRPEYRFSKSYLYECSTRTYIRSSGNTSTITTADGILGLRDIKNLLDHIVGLSFDQIDGLHRITYKYINIGSNSYKIPLIHEPVKIEKDLYMFWKVLTRNDMPSEESNVKPPQQEGYLKSFFPTLGMNTNSGGGRGGANQSDFTGLGLQRPDENKIVNIEQNNIEISLYTNESKDRIELFEQDLENRRKKAIKALSNFQTVNFYNHRLMKGGRERKQVWDTYKFHTSKKFENFFLPEKDKIMHILQTFCNDKAKYCRLGKQDYLGILLYGLPGCGKTSLIKCIAEYTRRDVYVLKLSEISTDEELKSIFQNETLNIYSNIDGVCHGDYLCPFSGRILVIEDMDVDIQCIKDRDIKIQEDQEFLAHSNRLNKKIFEVIEGSRDINPETLKTLMTTLDGVKTDYKSDQLINSNSGSNRRFNLDIFLNILDGIQEQDGTILIMSTNYPKNIDKALVRPGRCDLQIKFEKSKTETLLQMIEYYHSESPLLKEMLQIAPHLCRIDQRFTASQFCQVLYEHSDEQFLELLKHLDEERVIMGLLDHLNGELLEKQPGMDRQFSYSRLSDLDSQGYQDEDPPPYESQSDNSENDSQPDSKDNKTENHKKKKARKTKEEKSKKHRAPN